MIYFCLPLYGQADFLRNNLKLGAFGDLFYVFPGKKEKWGIFDK
jgi:hypothetical protein